MAKKMVGAVVMGVAILCAAPLARAAQGDWLYKVGVTLVDPKSNNLRVADVGTVEVDRGTNLGLTVTYMVTDNVGVELLAAAPFKHDIGIKGLGKIGETKQLPPTLSVQYHFMPAAAISPYVGVGFNWTLFSNEKVDPAIADRLSLDDSTGFAAQVGADIKVDDNWFINVDVRYIDIQTDATLTVDSARLKLGKVQIDPAVYSLMLGYRF
jgi:outer membrane protein